MTSAKFTYLSVKISAQRERHMSGTLDVVHFDAAHFESLVRLLITSKDQSD
jgi:hypothetical protein